MLIEEDVQRILNQLASGDSINVPFDSSTIKIRVIDGDTKLSLSASVYQGENYIPTSVRGCLSQQSPLPHPSILTYLSLDEQHFEVRLNYIGQAQSLTRHRFKEILEEFGLIAEEWRYYLDDHDKKDLVHVRVK